MVGGLPRPRREPVDDVALSLLTRGCVGRRMILQSHVFSRHVMSRPVVLSVYGMRGDGIEWDGRLQVKETAAEVEVVVVEDTVSHGFCCIMKRLCFHPPTIP